MNPLQKDPRHWHITDYAFMKAFCETCEYFAEQGAKPHPEYEAAKEAVAAHEDFKQAKREAIASRLNAALDLPSIVQAEPKDAIIEAIETS